MTAMSHSAMLESTVQYIHIDCASLTSHHMKAEFLLMTYLEYTVPYLFLL